MLYKKTIFAFVVFFLCSLASAELLFENENVMEVFKEQNFEENLAKAKNGDARAQYLVGAAYLHGLNEQKVKVDPDKGVFWLKKAGEHGVAEPYYELAISYREGLGVDQNVDKWQENLAKAAELGMNEALLEVANLYRDGNSKMGVKSNEKKYIYWLKKEAEAGAPVSIENLAWRYREGRGVEQDIDKAFEWIMKGVQRDVGSAHAYAAEFFENGLGTDKDLVKAYMLYDLSTGIGREAKKELAKKMTDDQIREAIARSWQWQLEHGVVRPSSDGYRYRYPLEESD